MTPIGPVTLPSRRPGRSPCRHANRAGHRAMTPTGRLPCRTAVGVNGAPGSADTMRPELHADPRAGDPGALGHRVLPGPLAAPAHDEQVTVADVMAEHGPAPVTRPEQQRPWRTERQDRYHGVLGAAPPDRVTMPRDTVPPVPVQTQPRGAQRFAEFGLVVLAERIPSAGEHRIGQGLPLGVEAKQ